MGTSQGCWAVIAARPIMRWAQSLESPHNVTFVDSTSSCDADGSTATVLLMGTKAGAMPADALVHSSQTREGYRAAFQLPKHRHPSCFSDKEIVFLSALSSWAPASWPCCFDGPVQYLLSSVLRWPSLDPTTADGWQHGSDMDWTPSQDPTQDI